MIGRIRRSILLAAFILALSVACRSTQPFTCETSSVARAPRNFGVVSVLDGPVYRGGQPRDCSELRFLKATGVKSVLKLNDRDLPLDGDEVRAAAASGLRIESFAFQALTIARPSHCAEVRRALAFLEDPANWPVYVHCTAGKDRTGYIVGLAERRKGVAAGDVMNELHAYGHRGWRSLLMPAIDRELARETPQCLSPQ